jgi:hypothetical protein
MPTASADRSTRARSTRTRAGAGDHRGRGAVERDPRDSRRVGSRFGGVIDVHAVAHLHHGDVVAGGHQQHVGQPGTEHHAGVARGRAVHHRDRAAEGHGAVVEPSAMPGSSRGRRSSSQCAGEHGAGDAPWARTDPGRHRGPSLLDHHHQLLEAVARTRRRPRAGAGRASRDRRAHPRTAATSSPVTRGALGPRRAHCACRRNCSPSRRASDGRR